MLKAQDVRNNRLEAVKKLQGQAEKIFDWVLDIIDTDTQNGRFQPDIDIFFTSADNITTNRNDQKTTYVCSLPEDISNCDRITILTALKEVVDQEIGYTAKLNKVSNYGGPSLQIVIE